MSETLSSDHPNLLKALARLKRILLAWGGLFLLMGMFTAAVMHDEYPLAPLPWLVVGVVLLLGRQPAYLGLVAIVWGMSTLSLIPNVDTLIGPDPISQLLDLSAIEGVALGVVRVLLLIMSWNQFMFYRMLYGTEKMSGLSDDLPAVPAMLPNKTDQLAISAQILSALGLLVVWGSFLVKTEGTSIHLLSIAFTTSMLSIGLGAGVAFSPTHRRKFALSAIGIGLVVFFSIFGIGRLTLL